MKNEVTLCTQPPDLRQCGSYGNAAGRVTSLVVDPTNPNVVFAGAAGGGVWKSTNAGGSWTAQSDGEASLAIGALGIDTTGQVIYAGTGEDNYSDSQIGQGILVSTNGGGSWTLSGQSIFANHYIGGIAVDRTNPQHAFVASDLGLYETGNEGMSWTLNTAYKANLTGFTNGPTPSGAVRQIIQDPTNANFWWLVADDGCSTEAGDLFISQNGGQSWSNLTPAGFGNQGASRIAVAFGTGGIGYLSGAGCAGNLIDLEATLNDGASWTQLFGATEYDPTTSPATPYHISRASPGLFNYFNFGASPFGQGAYDNVIAVDPTSPARAIFGGVTALTTTTAGGSFTDVGLAYRQGQGQIHPDYHAFAYWSHDHLYAGTDGGVYKTNDFGGSGVGGDWTNISAGMDTIQYYNGAMLDPSHMLGGAQDNGSPGNFAVQGSLPTATEYLDGDGTFTAIDPNSTSVWVSYPGLGIFKGSSTDPLGNSFGLAAPCSASTDPACGDRVEFVAPYLLDSTAGQKLIAGTNKVYYSGSGGAPGTWTAISNPLVNPTYPTRDALQALAMTPTGVTGEVMAASRYGRVFVSTQTAGSIPNTGTWQDVTGVMGMGLPLFPGYNVPCCNPTAVEPNGWIPGIAINPANPNEAWAVIGGLHVAHVWHTTTLNQGNNVTWLSMDGTTPNNVPDVPTDAVAFNPTSHSLYLGTETGIMVCTTCDGLTPAPAWSILGNLPNVKVNALTFTANNELVAWTHGRGAWALLTTTPALYVSPTTVNLTCIRGAATPPAQSVTLSNKGGGTLTWSVTPSSGLTVTPAPTPIAAGGSTVINVSATPCPSTAGQDPNPHSLAFTSNGGSPVVPVTIAATYRGQYTPVTPARILDTRGINGTPVGAPIHPLGPGQTLTLQVAGQGGIPPMTCSPTPCTSTPPSAVVINIAVTNTTGAPNSYLELYPGPTRPLAANLNWNQGQTVNNLVEAALDANGAVTVYNAAGYADVIGDVQGWVSTPGQGPANATTGLYNPLVPSRIMDTRDGTGGLHAAMSPGQTYTLQIAGGTAQSGQPSGIPASGASAVILNLAATGSTAPGDFLTLYPSDASRPTTSNLNFSAGQTKSNRVVVKLGATGAINIYNPSGFVQVIIDANGFFTDGVAQTTGAQFTGTSPARILDTRDGTGGYSGPIAAGHTISMNVAGRGGVPGMDSPAAPSAVVMNVTAVGGTAGSYFSIYPSDAQQPVIADLNWPAGAVIPNLVVVKVSPDGKANVFNPSGSVDMVADVVGWYN